MISKEYSAGMVKLSFWFLEFKKVIALLNDGMSFPEIRDLNLRENIFSAVSEARAIQIFNTVSSRAQALDTDFYRLFTQCDIANQKLIALVAIMLTDRLFFDFLYEVYREKLLIGVDELAVSDFSIFFGHKQVQSDRVAAWTDHTLKTLGTTYRTIMMEAGILARTTGRRRIIRPILDNALESKLKDCGMETILHALTGVK